MNAKQFKFGPFDVAGHFYEIIKGHIHFRLMLKGLGFLILTMYHSATWTMVDQRSPELNGGRLPRPLAFLVLVFVKMYHKTYKLQGV